MKLGLEGRYIIHKQSISYDENGNQVLNDDLHKIAEFGNLILDSGLRLLLKTKVANKMAVGTGTKPPEVTDVGLQGYLASSTNTGSVRQTKQLGDRPYYIDGSVIYTFGAGVGTGNITEIGVYTNDNRTSGDEYFSRALIKDSQGNPTSITKLDYEILYITYQLRFHIPSEEAMSTLSIGTDVYDVKIKPANITNWAISDTMTNQGISVSSIGIPSDRNKYFDDNIYMQVKDNISIALKETNYEEYWKEYIPSLPVGLGNYSDGFKTISVSTLGLTSYWQIYLEHQVTKIGIIKTSDYTLTLPPVRIGVGRYVA